MVFHHLTFCHMKKKANKWRGNELCHKCCGLISTSICPRSHTLGPNQQWVHDFFFLFHWARPSSCWQCTSLPGRARDLLGPPGFCSALNFYVHILPRLREMETFYNRARGRWCNAIYRVRRGTICATSRKPSKRQTVRERREKSDSFFRAFRNLRYHQHCAGWGTSVLTVTLFRPRKVILVVGQLVRELLTSQLGRQWETSHKRRPAASSLITEWCTVLLPSRQTPACSQGSFFHTGTKQSIFSITSWTSWAWCTVADILIAFCWIWSQIRACTGCSTLTQSSRNHKVCWLCY